MTDSIKKNDLYPKLGAKSLKKKLNVAMAEHVAEYSNTFTEFTTDDTYNPSKDFVTKYNELVVSLNNAAGLSLSQVVRGQVGYYHEKQFMSNVNAYITALDLAAGSSSSSSSSSTSESSESSSSSLDSSSSSSSSSEGNSSSSSEDYSESSSSEILI